MYKASPMQERILWVYDHPFVYYVGKERLLRIFLGHRRSGLIPWVDGPKQICVLHAHHQKGHRSNCLQWNDSSKMVLESVILCITFWKYNFKHIEKNNLRFTLIDYLSFELIVNLKQKKLSVWVYWFFMPIVHYFIHTLWMRYIIIIVFFILLRLNRKQ